MAHETPIQKGIRPLGCEEWQELLVDALDGTLAPTDSAAFMLHARDCAACAQLLEETRRGSEWLGYLHHAPEAPGDLVEKILARTTGVTPGLPVLTTGVTAVEAQPWLGRSVAILQRHGAESRLLMTLAMAFFSIAFTLNLTGVHLTRLRLSDLSPAALASSVSRQYYTTSAQVVRYYENLRFVYEVESRVNEFRRDSSTPGSSTSGSSTSGSSTSGSSGAGTAAPAQQPSVKSPAAPAPAGTSPSGANKGSAGSSKPGGSAKDVQPREGAGVGSEEPARSGKRSRQPRSANPMFAAPAEPILAGWTTPGSTPSALSSTLWTRECTIHAPSTVTTAAPRLSERNAVMSRIHDRTERSLA
ncbi:MAG: anti-sigma factor family protein [Acidobacteriaceae bacterium]